MTLACENLRVYSPAKLNLFLHVIGRRPDGYHELETYFQLIDLYDVIGFKCQPDPEQLSLTTNMPPTEGENLVLKAAKLLQTHAQEPMGCHITLEKHIPMGAGLGGGSSNAASTLLSLNHLWGIGLEEASLLELGQTLGADVPIFLKGSSAWAKGTGEKIINSKLSQGLWFILLKPKFGCHTGAIFQDPKLRRQTPPLIDNLLVNQPELDFSLPSDLWLLTHNDCEAVVCSKHPEVEHLIQALKALSPYARLTGTGSVCFAPFRSLAQAQLALTKIKDNPELPIDWYHICQGLTDSPSHRNLNPDH